MAMPPGGRGMAKRTASFKCGLRSKKAPVGSQVLKGAPAGMDNELQNILAKRLKKAQPENLKTESCQDVSNNDNKENKSDDKEHSDSDNSSVDRKKAPFLQHLKKSLGPEKLTKPPKLPTKPKPKPVILAQKPSIAGKPSQVKGKSVSGPSPAPRKTSVESDGSKTKVKVSHDSLTSVENQNEVRSPDSRVNFKSLFSQFEKFETSSSHPGYNNNNNDSVKSSPQSPRKDLPPPPEAQARKFQKVPKPPPKPLKNRKSYQEGSFRKRVTANRSRAISEGMTLDDRTFGLINNPPERADPDFGSETTVRAPPPKPPRLAPSELESQIPSDAKKKLTSSKPKTLIPKVPPRRQVSSPKATLCGSDYVNVSDSDSDNYDDVLLPSSDYVNARMETMETESGMESIGGSTAALCPPGGEENDGAWSEWVDVDDVAGSVQSEPPAFFRPHSQKTVTLRQIHSDNRPRPARRTPRPRSRLVSSGDRMSSGSSLHYVDIEDFDDFSSDSWETDESDLDPEDYEEVNASDIAQVTRSHHPECPVKPPSVRPKHLYPRHTPKALDRLYVNRDVHSKPSSKEVRNRLPPPPLPPSRSKPASPVSPLPPPRSRSPRNSPQGSPMNLRKTGFPLQPKVSQVELNRSIAPPTPVRGKSLANVINGSDSPPTPIRRRSNQEEKLTPPLVPRNVALKSSDDVPPPMPPRRNTGKQKELPPLPPDDGVNPPRPLVTPPRPLKSTQSMSEIPVSNIMRDQKRASFGSHGNGQSQDSDPPPPPPPRDPVEGSTSQFYVQVPSPRGSHLQRSSSVDSEGRPNYLELIGDSEDDDDDYEDGTDMMGVSRFRDEPLYQIYHCGMVARDVWRHNMEDQEPEECYDEALDYEQESYESVYGTFDHLTQNDGLSDDEFKSTLTTLVKCSAGYRTLWCEMEEVKSTGVLERMTDQEKKIQEALFEIITSEASYLKSLDVLINIFYESEKLDFITKQERNNLFSNVHAVRDTSNKFLLDLERRWNRSIVLDCDVLDIVYLYAHSKFNDYVKYCSNSLYQERKLKDLMQKKYGFSEIVRSLEQHPSCGSLPLHSFLSAPMQRITRLPLLVDAVCHRMNANEPHYQRAIQALHELQKVTTQCNNGAKQMADVEMLTTIDRTLEFKSGMKKIALVSTSRSLVKKGSLTRIFKEPSGVLKKKNKETLHLILFNDFLLVTKQRSGMDHYEVVDYATRISVDAQVVEEAEIPRRLPKGVPSNCKNIFVMALLENHDGKSSEFYFACNSASDRLRWVEAVAPAQQVGEDEKIYETWDCPQVQVIRKYVPRERDELSLEESDIINVLRKMNDGSGFYEGERLRDGQRGWFPANHTVEIHNAHVRARNLKQRYRLLTLSHTVTSKK